MLDSSQRKLTGGAGAMLSSHGTIAPASPVCSRFLIALEGDLASCRDA
jgi:hypothetical protein